MTISRALSDQNRVRVLMALEGQKLCVCQIVELLELAPSTVSKHMSILSNARLVEGRQEGRWRYYRIAGAMHQMKCEKSSSGPLVRHPERRKSGKTGNA